eukprot:1835429-Prymnesium_polylepis.4
MKPNGQATPARAPGVRREAFLRPSSFARRDTCARPANQDAANRRRTPPVRFGVPDQRGGDTSDTMYRIESLYRCIGVSLMYR